MRGGLIPCACQIFQSGCWPVNKDLFVSICYCFQIENLPAVLLGSYLNLPMQNTTFQSGTHTNNLFCFLKGSLSAEIFHGGDSIPRLSEGPFTVSTGIAKIALDMQK